MTVYTGTGDGGKTSLFSGERIAKSDDRIEAYGDVDELNAVIGSLAASLPQHSDTTQLRLQLTLIQSDLLQVGALLATTPDSPSIEHLKPLTAEHSQWLEKRINDMEDRLDTLNAFILPGGHPSAAWSHMARTVCRRTERRVVKLFTSQGLAENGSQEMMTYLNRLSDYFFVLARYCNLLSGVKDEIWRG
jgi:cob(I)alamin adenosyltransferase